MFQSPDTGQLKTPDPGLENVGCENEWDAQLTPSWLNWDT
jgi:hypothetical protein